MKECKKIDNNRATMDNVIDILKKLTNHKFCLLVGTGTFAIQIALQSLSNGKKEVLIPSLTCVTVPMAVKYANCENVFVDIDPSSLNMSIDSVLEKITGNTKAILATHLFGNPLNIPLIQKKASDVVIIEDAAQALGAKLNSHPIGSFGHISIFSFNQKIIDCGGGALLTSDKELYTRMRAAIRYYSSTKNPKIPNMLYRIFFRTSSLLYRKKVNVYPLTGFLSYLFRNKFSIPYFYASTEDCFPLLKELGMNIENRIKLAGMWKDHLSEKYFHLPSIEKEGPIYWRYTFLLKCNNARKRELFFKKCRKQRIPVGRLYYPPLHEIYSMNKEQLPISSSISRRICNVPTENLNVRDLEIYASKINRVAQDSFGGMEIAG